MIRILAFCFLVSPLTSFASDSFSVRLKLPTVSVVDNQRCMDQAQWNQVLSVSRQNKGLFLWRLEILPALAELDRLKIDYDRLKDNFAERKLLGQQERDWYQLKSEQSRKKMISDRVEKIIYISVIVLETGLLVFKSL